ncbi:MAG: neutral zinc metallopeptidase [bacterium]|nr:neutral zinc metallopeptidase [bacterium]
MRWKNARKSSNVEDRRGGGRKIARRATGGGLGIIILSLVAMYFGVDPSVILNLGSSVQEQSAPSSSGRTALTPEEQELTDFVSVVLAETEDTWHELFRQLGEQYREPTLVLFSGSVKSACGFAQAAVGPFYCPADQKVYIDLSFYDDLKNRFGAPGDFAQAYVIAHEIGHHVQTLLGVSQKVHELRTQVSEKEANALSVMQELQADCFAGVWANHADKARKILETGDVEEALKAAASIGDDRLQMQSKGYVTPDSFTHGSSKQRTRWFTQGIQSGKVSNCNTFKAEQL